jgi:hypothetical protein
MGAINDVVDATRVIKVARRKNQRDPQGRF